MFQSLIACFDASRPFGFESAGPPLLPHWTSGSDSRAHWPDYSAPGCDWSEFSQSEMLSFQRELAVEAGLSARWEPPERYKVL